MLLLRLEKQTSKNVTTQPLRQDWRKFESNKFIFDFDQNDWEQIYATRKLMLTFQ